MKYQVYINQANHWGVRTEGETRGVATFYGTGAEHLAREYAEWREEQEPDDLKVVLLLNGISLMERAIEVEDGIRTQFPGGIVVKTRKGTEVLGAIGVSTSRLEDV